MKERIKILMMLLLCLGCYQVHAQTDEAAQLLLNVEKLAQFKQILSDLKKGYQTLNNGYNSIKDISQGNFKLHKVFLDGLLEISPEVKKYKKVAEIIEGQLVLVKEYKAALARFQAGKQFDGKELDYIQGVYSRLLKQSLRDLDDLVTVITAGKLRMSDDERIKAIDGIASQMADKVAFLRSFNSSTGILAVQRMKEHNDAQTMKKIYGID